MMTGQPPAQNKPATLPPHVLAEARRIADEAPPLSGEIKAELRDRMRPIPEPERRAS